MMTSPLSTIPKKVQVLVIGGGPGGSYAATVLAREGIEVLVLEAEKFPRYHIGESMLASLRHFLRFIDFEEAFENYGFTRKTGAAFKLNRHKREGYTDFVYQDPGNYSWNVIRSESDEILFKYAAECGAITLDQTRVIEIRFKDENPQSRPVSALWKNKSDETGEVYFDWLIDASGRSGMMSAKYLKTRKYNQSLKNVAMWGYWSGTKAYAPGTSREGSPLFEALSDESGWAWFIPLGDKTSVGIVMNQYISFRKKEEGKKLSSDFSLSKHYHEELRLAPMIMDLIGEAKLVSGLDGGGVKFASDYSYSASTYAGDHYRLVGDAAAFIDPYFSSGFHLALSSGLSAAATICAVLKGECNEEEASEWHSDKVGTSYTRFLLVVLSAYRQILAQDFPVLADIDEDNFDRAFEHFRPIIQGKSDVKRLSEEELQKTIEFCTKGFQPTLPEERAAILSIAEITENGLIKEKPSDKSDADTKRVIAALNARKVLRTEDINHINNFVTDEFKGHRLRLERGALGLQKV